MLPKTEDDFLGEARYIFETFIAFKTDPQREFFWCSRKQSFDFVCFVTTHCTQTRRKISIFLTAENAMR
jgi:hypothetical protein